MSGMEGISTSGSWRFPGEGSTNNGANNDAPHHCRLKVRQDPDMGIAFLIDRETGDQYDVSDDESVLTTATCQQSPDGRRSRPSAGDTAFIPSEDLLAALVTDLRTDQLTDEQLSRFSALRGILSMTDSVRSLRDEVATRIDELSTAVVGATHKLETTLENNLRILRATGATEEQLSALDAQPMSILKQTRFASTESASSAGTRGFRNTDRGLDIEPLGLNQSISGYLTPQYAGTGTATVFEAFVAEKGLMIARLIERQLGEAMEPPPRSPKIKDPPMYKGDDDDTIFMTWLGRLCTWFQAYSLGGPKLDAHRIIYLKNALDAHALDWFETEIELTDRESDVVHEFTPIICAMHKRFVTSATATRATKEYEAIRYDPSQGIEFLVSELLCTANRMRESPSQFSIRQQFMRLLPASVHDELIRRGLFVEYTSLDVLKGHARSWIESQGQMRGRASTNVARTASTPRSGGTSSSKSAPRAPARAAPRAPTQTPTSTPAISSRTATTAVARSGPTLPSGPTQRSNKTCFGCGVVGHIASDPICPRYNDSASSRPRPAAQLHAQRVVASYSVDEEDNAAGDDLEHHPDVAHSPEPDMEGLWGGSQYDANELLDDEHQDDRAIEDEEDPHATPDLSELMDDAENTEVRVGAMRQYPHHRHQHFSMRVSPSDEEGPLPSTVPGSSVASNSRSTILDMDVLVVDMAGSGYPLWSAAAEAQRATDRLDRPNADAPTHEELLADFDSRNGPGPHMSEATLELLAIDTVRAEIHARAMWTSLVHLQPAMVLGYSAAFLRTTAVDVELQSRLFERHVVDLRQALSDVLELLRHRDGAMNHIIELRGRPTGSQSRVPSILETAGQMHALLTEDIETNVHMLEHRLARIIATQHDLAGELTRRLIEREAYEHSLEDGIRDQNAPALPTRLERYEEMSGIPCIDLSPPSTPPPHDWQNTSLSPSSMVESPPRSDPPSYPGSPHDSDEYYPLEDRPELTRVPGFHSTSLPTASNPDLPPTRAASGPEAPVEMAALVGLPQDNSSRGPEVVLRSVMVHTSREAERLTTYLLPNGDLQVVRSALPSYHRRHHHFQDEHHIERWADLGLSPERDDRGEVARTVDGFPDRTLNLFPGLVYHEGLASSGPEADDEDAWPGFRAQVRALRIEHISNIRRPRSLPPVSTTGSIGLMDQPSRSSKTIACLSALVKIGSTSAYALFDSGSNTDSMMPEFANAINGVRITLTEQVTLQLGCIGSRSKISFGTRVPIDFGGVKGHVYFDQVNLDRYDVVIGTPFMNKHGVVLDFGNREVHFPRGQTIKALTSIEEASLFTGHIPKGMPASDGGGEYPFVLISETECIGGLAHAPFIINAKPSRRATIEEVADEDTLKSPLPSLPWWHKSIYIPESEFREDKPTPNMTGDYNFHTSSFDIETSEDY
ncbi:hypothetical protein B0H13DRAFT_2350373 [Mycena leptocephala]|nr:hypothetical protein B0H13DRAFT_2350373 [Mycena leptocephala]